MPPNFVSKACGVFSSRVLPLPSQRQPRAMKLCGPTTQREVPHARHWGLLHSLSLLREALSGQMTLLHSNCVCIRTLIEPTYVLHTEQAYGLHWCQVKSDVKMMGWVVILLLIAFLTFPLMFVISEYTWIKITDNMQKYTEFIINNCGICGPPIDVFCPLPTLSGIVEKKQNKILEEILVPCWLNVAKIKYYSTWEWIIQPHLNNHKDRCCLGW